jgi:hypothetical protein
MADAAKQNWNRDPLWSFLLALAALVANVGFFVSSALQVALAWLSVALAVVALFFLTRGASEEQSFTRRSIGEDLSTLFSAR